MALENSNDIDYVTEKFFQPMEQGESPRSLSCTPR